MKCYINGKFIDSKKAAVSVSDSAFQRGYGAFEVMRAKNGRVLRFDDHFGRFIKSIRLIGIKPSFTRTGLGKIVNRLLRHNGGGEFLIKLILSGGGSTVFVDTDGKPRLYVLFFPFRRFEKFQARGVGAVTVSYERFMPQAKTLNYLPAVLGYKYARRAGAREAIFVEGGFVREGTTSNIFMVRRGMLYTPKLFRVLDGITRKTILELAKKTRIKVIEKGIKFADLRRADEVFISSTNREIFPIIKLDGRKIGGGAPGSCTRRIQKLLRDFIDTSLAPKQGR